MMACEDSVGEWWWLEWQCHVESKAACSRVAKFRISARFQEGVGFFVWTAFDELACLSAQIVTP